MSSKAFQKLELLRITDVEELLAARRTIAGTAPGRPLGVASLNRAVVVLVAAQIEGFVEDIFEETVVALSPVPALESLSELGLRNFRNPTPQNIVTLFKSLGVSDIMSPEPVSGRLGLSWQRTPPPVARQVLGDLVDDRNRVAHGALINVGLSQLKRYRVLLSALGRCLDRDLANLVKNQVGSKPW